MSTSSNQARTRRGNETTTAPCFPIRPKKQKLKKDGTPYKPRKGWGPYSSVPNERSVAFNLQLDVQNLQQEVSNLLALRDILETKALVQRHTPEGSLTRLVNEYLYVFRKGVVPQAAGGERIVEHRDQLAFMHSVMDPDVELGPGLPRGPDVIMDQMANYTNFLRFISLTGIVDSIIVAEDSVAVSDAAWFTFQITRSTIEMIFPHIIGHEWLVALLVGQEVEAPARSTFHFNALGKCYRYDVEMDFVGAFMSVVKNPRVVDMLLGRALISYNGMFRITSEEVDLDEEKAPASIQHNVQPIDGGNIPKDGSERITSSLSSEEFCRKIVEDYFAAFARGLEEDTTAPSGVSQRDFFMNRFGHQKKSGTTATEEQVSDRWRVLGECFQLLTFQQKGAIHIENDDNSSSCLVVANATYIVRITFYSIQVVFPHVLSDDVLLDALVGKVLMVPSQIFFSIDKTTGYISRLTEKMDFAVAIADLLNDQRDLSRVISQAKLTSDGVDAASLHAQPVSTPTIRFQDQIPRDSFVRSQNDAATGSSFRTMNLTDILD